MDNVKLYDLTIPQKSIYLTEQYASGTTVNLISGDTFFEEKVNSSLIEKALNIYIQKNDSVRLRICMVDGKPKQYISPYTPYKLKVINVSNKEELEKYRKQIISTPIKFFDSDLFSFTLFMFADGTATLDVTFHHIISDAWTMGLFIKKFMPIYLSLLKGESIDTSVDFSYLEFIDSEKNYLNSTRFQKDKEFWNNLFDSEPEPSLISDKKEKIIDTTAKRKIYSLDNKLYSNIIEFCKNEKCSVYTFFMAIYSLYLARINNSNSSTIGTPVLNRTNFKEKNTVGMYISTIPFSIKINYDDIFSAFLRNVMTNQMTFFRHQKYPYSALLEDLKSKYNFSYNLYDIAVSYQNARDDKDLFDIKFHTEWAFNENCSDTLQIHFYDMDDTGIIQIFYDYQTAKLSASDIENMHKRIFSMAEQVLENPNLLLKDIDITYPEEKEKILGEFNSSYVEHPKNVGVHELIERIAEEYPNNIAVTYNNEKITYSELIKRATQIAKILINKGVKPRDCVSILFKEKDTNLICSMLGVLKAGAAFLAIYADYPDERIEYILQNSKSKLLITENAFKEKNFSIPMVFIEDTNSEEQLSTSAFPKVLPDDNAYIIYTSGSTGKPKGTMQSHNNLINFVYSFNKYLDGSITEKDIFLSVTNISFDVSMSEIFTALMYGANLHLYKDLNCSTTSELAKYIVDNKITFAYFPPSMLHDIYEELKNYDNIALNKMLVGVEPIKAVTLKNYLTLNKDMRIINGYGPSETTICCTMFKFDKNLPDNQITPIGSPIGNSKILIYDKMKKLVPIGIVGEIYVQGECVGNGYLNNPEKTAESFDLENRIYKTGDSAKWLPDGSILFVGRNDNQIKYRGYRIDMGEIEATIRKIPGVKNCIVLLNKKEDTSSLVAFIILDNLKLTEEKFRNVLITKLPHYMIPSEFVFLDEFPLNTSGKIDRKELFNLLDQSITYTYVAPRNNIEQMLADIWAKTLKVEKVGIEDNFFNIGGDSLSAIKIVAAASKYGITLSAQSFYKYPTIKLLVKYAIDKKEVSNLKETYSSDTIPLKKESISKISGDILLVGATGFLGSHILNDLLNNTNFKVYCLIRGKSEEHSKKRLKERLNYYFGNTLDNYFDNRIIVLQGDFSEKNLGLSDDNYSKLSNIIDTVINAAATVKHVGDYKYFEKINVTSVKNLIEFCKKAQNIKLVHMSTLSIAGNTNNKEEVCKFTEENLYINQDFEDNVYIKTKFLAEKLLFDAIRDGLNVTIFRLGNITWRNSDGKFQYNSKENLFFNLMKYVIKVKELPIALKEKCFNLSPVENCSSLIVNILLNDNVNNVYHIYNHNMITLEQIVNYLNEFGLNIKFIDNSLSIMTLEKNFDKIELSAYIYELITSSNVKSNIEVSNPYTMHILDKLKFKWSEINAKYLKKGLEELIDEESN